MGKPKRKLTRAEKAAKARRRAEFMTIFVNGRQKSVRRPVLVAGVAPDEFIRENADPIWLHQTEMWESMTVGESDDEPTDDGKSPLDDEQIPF